MRQSAESDRARFAYNEYLAMGPGRSLAKLSAGAGPSGAVYRLATLETWSASFGWQARVAEHDAQRGQAMVEEAEAARDRQREERRLDRLHTAILARKLATQILEAKQDPEAIKRQSLFAAKELLDYADNAERLDLGEATQRLEHTGPGGSDLFRIVRVTAAYRPGDVTDVIEGDVTELPQLPA